MDATSQRPAKPAAAPEATSSLRPGLGEAAARASAWIGGPVLVFTAASGSSRPQLRAAARLATPEVARCTGDALAAAVAEVLRTRLPREHDAPAGTGDGIARVALLPLLRGETALGVVAFGLAEAAPPPPGLLDAAASTLGERIDAARLADEVEALRSCIERTEHLAEAKNDEMLKLSEEIFAQDIELLQNTEKLGKVEKLKSDFIEKMSRELRTPLNSIIEAIIAVLAGENEALSDSGKASLRAALDEGTAFLRTLQNILDLWRIKQGELPVETQDVNFREVTEEAIFSVQDTLGGKPIRIEKHFEEPFPKIRTDLAKINQILFLLLDNAAKFTAQGRIGIRARVAGGQLHCEVRDTGIGICPDDQQYIFDEFFQVDDAASTKYRGAGLGLALVRDLLTLLDGGITLTSEVGEGSCFAFWLPVRVID